MNSKSKKLGAFADIYQREHLDGAVTKLKISKIYPSKSQPREDRTKGVEDLSASIKKDGLLSPIIVTKENDGYRIIAGERRFHASKKLGWEEIECKIISRKEMDYKRIALVENLQREELSATEEAVALFELKKQENLSDLELSKTVGKSRNYVTEILSIASLPQDAARLCNDAGIQNKNILIQAVQSYKKGQLDLFIGAYKAGTIKTVKQAKEYNKPHIPKKTPQDSPLKTIKTESTVSREGRIITITCKTDKASSRIFTEVKKII